MLQYDKYILHIRALSSKMQDIVCIYCRSSFLIEAPIECSDFFPICRENDEQGGVRAKCGQEKKAPARHMGSQALCIYGTAFGVVLRTGAKERRYEQSIVSPSACKSVGQG